MMRRRAAPVLALLVALALFARPVAFRLRAAQVLARIAHPVAAGGEGAAGPSKAERWLVGVGRYRVEERPWSVPGAPPIAARLYVPADASDPPGFVLVHGVHYRGIDEPRLVHFAQALAATGVLVLTPEVRELRDYRVDPASVTTIGRSVLALSQRLHGSRVGAMGLSFAGGLSLIAAADPRFAAGFALVVAVGAHDDLGRVLRYFASGEAPRPGGTILRAPAHPYGPAIVVFDHVDDFFAAADVPVAREALRLWLHEDEAGARARAEALTTDASRALMKTVFDRDVRALAPAVMAEAERYKDTFAAVSPDAHLAGLHVPVFLLHGASDAVIPPSETEWLARDTPRGMLREVLVSPALEHVEVGGKASLGEQVALVEFLSRVLEALQESARP
jgi:pimeloyl-ACP methyl ester carboxylesterase